MYSIAGQLTGLAPFLFNRMSDSSVLDSGVSGGKPSSADARRKEAEAKVYMGKDGLLALPAWTLKRLMLDGARESKIKINKTPLWKYVSAVVFPNGDPSFGIETFDFIHECVGRIPPRTGKAAIIRRPALETGWQLAFRLNVLTDIPNDKLKCALDVAGPFVGLGSWRPEFGRFEVSNWRVVDELAEVLEVS